MDTLVRILSSKVSWGQALAIIIGFGAIKIFFYLRDRHWKWPTIKELLAPSENYIEFCDFLEIAINDGWQIGRATEDEAQPFKFDKILREAAHSNAVTFKGRAVYDPYLPDDDQPLIAIENRFWLGTGVDLFSYAEVENTKTITYIDKAAGPQHWEQYSDLHINEKEARKWLTCIAYKYK